MDAYWNAGAGWAEFDLPGGGWVLALRLMRASAVGRPVIAELRILPGAVRDVHPGPRRPHETEDAWRERYQRTLSRRIAEWSGGPAAVPPGGVTVRQLRAVSMAAIRDALDEAAPRLDELERGIESTLGRTISATRGARRGVHEKALAGLRQSMRRDLALRTGRRGKGAGPYAWVAGLYVEALEAGERPILRAVAKAAGLSESRVRDVLHEARRRELLTRPWPGLAGGQLTPLGRSARDEYVSTRKAEEAIRAARRAGKRRE